MTTTHDLYAHLRAAVKAGALILANEGRHGRPDTYHVVSAEGESAFTCEPHEYLAVVPFTASVQVGNHGVRFGPNCWISHEQITGLSADDLNAGVGIIAQQYKAWVSTNAARHL